MIIYKTTNLVNNKIYIGQDKHNNQKYLGSGDLIKRAIKKYGKENFKKDMLCVCDNQAELDEKERFYIKEFNSIDKEIGYNIALGGRNGTTFGRKMSSETKKKMSDVRIGIKLSDEHKRNISKAHMGKQLSDETKNKMSKAQKLIIHEPMSETTKEKIRKVKIGKKASNETKEKMSKAHSGEKNHFYGKKHSEETLRKTRKEIIQLSADGEFIKEWVGVNEAAKLLGIRQSSISNVLVGRNKITSGYKFIYKNG